MKRRVVKTFAVPFTLKADSDQTGAFEATFATLNVIDRDKDVTVKGAFQDGQEVRIARWGHNWSDLPVGRGVIHADDERAWVDGQFFMDTAHGLDTYKTVKALGDLQEWSYGFDITKWSVGEFEGQQVRFLEGLDVFEVSPVMLGAGIGTRTEAIKAAKVGRRNAAADAARLQKAHDLLVEAGASCEAKDDDDEDTDDADEENEDGKASKGGSSKAKAGSTEILAARVALELAELGN